MSDREINKAIAEACGEDKRVIVKNYCHDQNAMEQARKCLTEQQQIIYARNLEMIVAPSNARLWSWALINATAKQHALAFIKSL